MKRIICPPTDAFAKYEEIMGEVCKQSNKKLVLIALGPTATILSYGLAKHGYHHY
ncbi:GT-D fold domain-containing glycosyltransferase [Bacillus sp. T3]|uniref:GT-D fold domain-containing glycosyltransferase n=1 Tax=Bacillus sp. T3 TaxID=467262 RepID=UPI0039943E8E